MYKLKSNFPDHFISILIRVYEGEFHAGLLENEVKLLYGSDDEKEIPLGSSAVVTWQQYRHCFWRNIQISKFKFYQPGYSTIHCTNFYRPQEDHDIPSLHSGSRQIESTDTLVNREGLTYRVEENPQLLRSFHCKIFISK